MKKADNMAARAVNKKSDLPRLVQIMSAIATADPTMMMKIA